MLTPRGLSPLEATFGAPVGVGPPVDLPDASPGVSPWEALEAAVEPALLRPPCVVAFSGGRDSSLLLAAAVRAARRTGAPPPVPVTMRYPQLAETEESSWQELVLRHFGVDDWVRMEPGDDLDYIGLLARPHLLREGPLYPANAHSVVPLAKQAAGGTLLMGMGGDELLGDQRWRALNDLLGGRRRPEAKDAARLAMACLPGPLRGRAIAARDRIVDRLPWLRPKARKELARAFARTSDEPVRWNSAVLHAARHRGTTLAVATMQRIAEAEGVDVRMPLLDPGFVAALARAGGRTGWGTRDEVMGALAGDVLPDEVVRRPRKATFAGVFCTDTTRAFAERWSGDGVDDELIDTEVLRDIWLRPAPMHNIGIPLQAAWLHQQRAS